APASAHSWSGSAVPPPQPMAPIARPRRSTGAPPGVGRISPFRTVGTIAQNPPLATIGASSEFGFLKAAAAMALARDVSVLKKPVPSPRAESTSRPASSTTVTLMGELRALAFPCAARRAFSAISSVISIMNSSGMMKRPRGTRQHDGHRRVGWASSARLAIQELQHALGDAVGVEAVLGVEPLGVAGLAEAHHAQALDRRGHDLAQELAHRAPEPAVDGMVLDGDHAPGLARREQEGLLVERLDGGDIDDLGVDAVGGELLGRLQRIPDRAARGQNGHVRARAQDVGLAEAELVLVVVHGLEVLAREPQVERVAVLD